MAGVTLGGFWGDSPTLGRRQRRRRQRHWRLRPGCRRRRQMQQLPQSSVLRQPAQEPQPRPCRDKTQGNMGKHGKIWDKNHGITLKGIGGCG